MPIRIGTSDDIDAAATIWELAHNQHFGFVPLGAKKERALAFLREKVPLPSSIFLVSETNGTVAGILFARQARTQDGAGDPIPGLLHISYVAVAPPFWGKGIAKALLEQLESVARTEGYDRLQLWMVPANVRARRLYEGMGFWPSGGAQFAKDFGTQIAHYERTIR